MASDSSLPGTPLRPGRGGWRTIALVVPLVLAGGTAARAQAAGPCPADTTAGVRICQAGADLLTAYLPVEGLLVSGGNPVPGTAAVVGKLGHARLAGRIGFTTVTIPDARYDGTSDTVALDKRLLIPLPRLDLAVGLFSKKLPMGTAGADLLGSAMLFPTSATRRLRVDDNARHVGPVALGLGYGIRLAMAMAPPKPTVSLSVMKRDMPSLRFGDRTAGDSFSVATNLSAINARLLVGGRAGMLTIAAGGGIDLYKGAGSVTYPDSIGRDTTVTVSLSTSRLTTLVNAGLELGPLGLWAEGGFQIGKQTPLQTIFRRHDPNSGRFYGGVGAALQF